jgi:arylsulfatase A-like enzyme
MNVVIFVIEDVRWDSIGAAGNPVVKTPRIDQLARERIRLSSTTSNCST